MTKKEPPNKDAFDKLLRWLGPDPDKAAKKYQAIHLRIIRIFAAKGCCDPEDLADQSFNVATVKIDWLLENYVGDPSLYIYGIAKKIFLELKPKPIPEPLPARDTVELEGRSTCLDQCLERLTTAEEKRLVLRYHENDKQVRIRGRRQLAEELGLSMNALRIKVCYIHARLRPCIRECLQLLDE